MEFLKRSFAESILFTSSCNNACLGNCNGESDHVAKQKGSRKKSS